MHVLSLRKFRRFLKDSKAGVLIEMAMVTPVLMIILMGGFETARYIYTNQKIQRTAMSLADLAARGKTMTAIDINNLFAAADEVAKPFNISSDGRVFVSSVIDDGTGAPEVAWQRGAGAIAATSTVGIEGGAATISDAFLIQNDQSVIVTEIFYDYQPFFASFLTGGTLYHQATYRPRLSRTVELLP